MSVVVTVAAAGGITVAAQVFAGIVTAAATALGMKVVSAPAKTGTQLREEASQAEADRLLAEAKRVEVTLATEASLEKFVAERASLMFADDKIEMTVSRDIRGKVSVHAHGEGVSRAEVTARATKLLGLIQQQVAYREVVLKMKAHGLAVETEEKLADGTVRVRLRMKK